MVKVLPSSFEQFFWPFTMFLVKGPLKGDFLDIYLTTSFGVHQFKNTSGMMVIVLKKKLTIESKFRKSKKILKSIFCC